MAIASVFPNKGPDVAGLSLRPERLSTAFLVNRCTLDLAGGRSTWLGVRVPSSWFPTLEVAQALDCRYRETGTGASDGCPCPTSSSRYRGLEEGCRRDLVADERHGVADLHRSLRHPIASRKGNSSRSARPREFVASLFITPGTHVPRCSSSLMSIRV